MTDSEIMAGWHREHIEKSLNLFKNRDLKVLVIGCNRGEECKIFRDCGVKEITGIDLIDDIGINFVDKNVKYYKASAEKLDFFKDETFDIVYSFATFEHINDIESAYNEAWRVIKKGGLMHIYASPLWNSPYGSHYETTFLKFPWIHLYCSADEMEAFCKKEKIDFTRAQIDYLLFSNDFNRRSALDYKYICSKLKNAEIIENTLSILGESGLDQLSSENLAKLKKHYCKDDLLAVWHLIEAKKQF